MIDTFLKHIGNGELDAVRTMLAANPTLVNAVGAHPFWGGRPQPLHVAIEGGRRPMIELLLEHGADVSGTNDQYDHWSPLMLAIDRNRPDVIEELRKRGAKIGLTEALMLADDARVDELLRDGLPSYAPNGGSILAFARTPHAIDRLLDLGADTQTKDRWGSSPIDAMSRLGRRGQPLVRHLISRGVPASPREYARLGDLATLSRVIADDPSIAKQDAVMMGAVDFSHHDLVEWLLAHGANVNARADAQARQSALHSAAWNGDVRMVELLVNHGADVHARDAEYNASPLGWAETSIVVTNNAKCEAVAAYLRSRS